MSGPSYHRNEIIRTLVDGGWEDHEIQESLQAILDSHAHSLADRLRKYADSDPGDGMYRAGLRDAANDIDPRVVDE